MFVINVHFSFVENIVRRNTARATSVVDGETDQRRNYTSKCMRMLQSFSLSLLSECSVCHRIDVRLIQVQIATLETTLVSRLICLSKYVLSYCENLLLDNSSTSNKEFQGVSSSVESASCMSFSHFLSTSVCSETNSILVTQHVLL